jgi:hypothetical protein
MNKDSIEMAIEGLDLLYGKPELVATITHVLGLSESLNHDLFTVEVITEGSKRLKIRLTEATLRNFVNLIDDRLDMSRPKAN